jgi:hypothetical protein
MRETRSVFTHVLIWTLVATTFVMGWFPEDGRAMLAPTEASGIGPDQSRMDSLQRIQRVLESKIIGQRLESLGLTPGEIQTRLSRLSDAQLHQMANQLDALMPGGDALGIIVVLLVIALLVVLLIYLLGHRIEIKKN